MSEDRSSWWKEPTGLPPGLQRMTETAQGRKRLWTMVTVIAAVVVVLMVLLFA